MAALAEFEDYHPQESALVYEFPKLSTADGKSGTETQADPGNDEDYASYGEAPGIPPRELFRSIVKAYQSDLRLLAQEANAQGNLQSKDYSFYVYIRQIQRINPLYNRPGFACLLFKEPVTKTVKNGEAKKETAQRSATVHINSLEEFGHNLYIPPRQQA